MDLKSVNFQLCSSQKQGSFNLHLELTRQRLQLLLTVGFLEFPSILLKQA